MMENRDDGLLRQFFAQHTFEPVDNGFTQQIMRKLLRRLVNLNRIRVVSCYLSGVIFLPMSNALNQLYMVFNNFVGDINSWIASTELDIQASIMVYLATLIFAFLGAYQAVESNRQCDYCLYY